MISLDELESESSLFGRELASSSDTLVVSAPFKIKNSAYVGSVYIFERSSEEFWSVKQRLMPQNVQERFGEALALNEEELFGSVTSDD